MKIEFYDDEGTKHTVSLEGALTKDKVLKVLDYAELMGRLQPRDIEPIGWKTTSKFERVRNLATTFFKERAFSSQDVQRSYQEHYGEHVLLSTVSTYLSRLVDRGVVERSGSPAAWTYVLKPMGTLSWGNLLSK